MPEVSIEPSGGFVPLGGLVERVTTGAKGQFQLPAVPAGSHRLVAAHDAYPSAASPILTFDGVTATSAVEIVLARGFGHRWPGGRHGRTRPPGPRCVSTRSVLWAAQTEQVADKRGQFRFRGLHRGRVGLVAESAEATSAVNTIVLRGGDNPRDVTLVLREKGTISGIVVKSSRRAGRGRPGSCHPEPVQ